EIKLLTSYVRLEQLRANFSFDFEVKCEESLLDEGIRVPSMILQPLLENAILHGVSNQSDGKITLSFVDQDKTILCCIEDNGEGYLSHAQKKKTREYKSRAMTIVKDRLRLLNSNDGGNIVLTDLSTEGGTGTRVDIVFPIFY
ncbi:MAG: hypothetical protein MK066_13955, partial [Crocinitomicaceae bacterium]|nr:hypothetical protein [Crocinitomicaceae bacterium]